MLLSLWRTRHKDIEKVLFVKYLRSKKRCSWKSAEHSFFVNDIWNKSYMNCKNENEEMIVAVNAIYAIA